MGKVVKGLFGDPMKGQRKQLQEEAARLARVEEGQKRAARGGRGFLAYVDKELKDKLG